MVIHRWRRAGPPSKAEKKKTRGLASSWGEGTRLKRPDRTQGGSGPGNPQSPSVCTKRSGPDGHLTRDHRYAGAGYCVRQDQIGPQLRLDPRAAQIRAQWSRKEKKSFLIQCGRIRAEGGENELNDAGPRGAGSALGAGRRRKGAEPVTVVNEGSSSGGRELSRRVSTSRRIAVGFSPTLAAAPRPAFPLPLISAHGAAAAASRRTSWPACEKERKAGSVFTLPGGGDACFVLRLKALGPAAPAAS